MWVGRRKEEKDFGGIEAGEFGRKRMLKSRRQWDVSLNRSFGLMAKEGPNSHLI
jgi:hypothetical protein